MPDNPSTPASKDRRQEVFRALVLAQDAGASVQDSRADTARGFGLSLEEVRGIEREGIASGWPPLD